MIAVRPRGGRAGALFCSGPTQGATSRRTHPRAHRAPCVAALTGRAERGCGEAGEVAIGCYLKRKRRLSNGLIQKATRWENRQVLSQPIVRVAFVRVNERVSLRRHASAGCPDLAHRSRGRIILRSAAFSKRVKDERQCSVSTHLRQVRCSRNRS
jgi:hypothetical protein